MPQEARRPAGIILLATVVAGGSGYLISVLVPLASDVDTYAMFAITWSAVFFLVNALGGLQQEATRAATAEGDVSSSSASPLIVALVGIALVGVVSAILVALAVGSGVLVVPPASGGGIVAGAAAYVPVAVLSGVLYGARMWRSAAALTIIDGLLRCILVVLALLLAPNDIAALTWAVVASFPIATIVVAAIARRGGASNVRFDVGPGHLTWNAVQLIAASAAMAALVSGVPLLLDVVLASQPDDLAAVILVLTLTRAPLVIPALALQGLLIVRFVARQDSRRAVELAAVSVAVTAVLALAAAVIGPPVLTGVFGAEYALDPLAIALIVASSGLLVALAILGAALIAANRHGANTLAWLTALAATIAVLLLDGGPIGTAVGTALVTGSAVGAACAAAAVLFFGRARS